MNQKILVIDDDPTVREIVRSTLWDYDVVSTETLEEAKKSLGEDLSCILLDINLPDGDGLRFLGMLRQDLRLKNVPLSVLSGEAGISHKVMAFDYGADDYIQKPFDPLELRSRITSKIRKNLEHLKAQNQRIVGDLCIDLERHKVLRRKKNGGEDEVVITALEMKLLTFLTQRLEQVYTRDQIMDHVWGNTFITERTVDSHIAHLRQKLLGSAIIIDTVKGVGYRCTSRAS